MLKVHGSDVNTWSDEHPDRPAALRAAARNATAVSEVSWVKARRILAVAGVQAVHLPVGRGRHAARSLESYWLVTADSLVTVVPPGSAL